MGSTSPFPLLVDEEAEGVQLGRGRKEAGLGEGHSMSTIKICPMDG